MNNIQKSLLKNKNWDQAYREAIEHQTFAKREASTRLMPPKKRRILLKLLALKMLQERDSEASPEQPAPKPKTITSMYGKVYTLKE